MLIITGGVDSSIAYQNMRAEKFPAAAKNVKKHKSPLHILPIFYQCRMYLAMENEKHIDLFFTLINLCNYKQPGVERGVSM